MIRKAAAKSRKNAIEFPLVTEVTPKSWTG